MYRKFLTEKNGNKMTLFNKYKNYRNKLTAILRAAEKGYYANKLHKHRTNLRKVWRTINEIVGKSVYTPKITEIDHNGSKTSDAKVIAEAFNHYFSNLGPALARAINRGSNTPTDYLKNRTIQSIFLNPVTPSEIIDIIALMNNSYSKGYDDISMVVIKQCSVEVSSILSDVFNLSLAQGIFHDQLKIAKVIPIFKSGNKSNVANYRPISLLSPFSKILENFFYSRLISFVNKSSILADTQYGFMKNLSTELALLDLTNQITKALDDRQITVGIFLDLSKAFDTVNHSILLDKLEHYGIRITPLNWIPSYLSNRYQCVAIEDTFSSLLPLTCGVPQRSILGPLLFILYLYDIQTIRPTDRSLIMFADDTNIFATGYCPLLLSNTLNVKLQSIGEWFSANIFSL